MGFQGKEGSLASLIFLKIFRIREKGPFADDIVQCIETLIDRLKSKIGHSDIIAVGVDETD